MHGFNLRMEYLERRITLKDTPLTIPTPMVRSLSQMCLSTRPTASRKNEIIAGSLYFFV